MMQKARVIVTGTPESRRNNFEITCYGDHISLCFYSGARGNQLVVQVEGDKIRVKTTRTAWIEWVKSVFEGSLEYLKDIFVIFFGIKGEPLTGKPACEMIKWTD
jgi:hypothetical protein